MDINDLVREVASLRDKSDLNRISEAHKVANDTISQLTKLTFSVGDTVTFKARKGSLIEGTIRKINRKNIKVKEEMKNGVNLHGLGALWTVHPNLLEKVMA